MDKLLSYLAARIKLKVCNERRACEKHICNFKQQKKAPEKTHIAMHSNGPQKQLLHMSIRVFFFINLIPENVTFMLPSMYTNRDKISCLKMNIATMTSFRKIHSR